MAKLCIIADDLTGATDTGVQFSKYGIPTAVVFNCKDLNNLDSTIEVVAVNTETRKMSKKMAYAKIKSTLNILKQMGYPIFYKKIDSTLRGNPDVEIEAMLDEFNSDLAIVVPAFPANGRIVKDGYLYVKRMAQNGEDILQKLCYIPDVLRSLNSRCISVIGLKEVRKGASNIKSIIEKYRGQNGCVLVFDAETNDDLRNISVAIEDYVPRAVIAASAGLAEQIPANWKIFTKYISENSMAGSILFLIGTQNKVTAEQVAILKDKSFVNVIEMKSDVVTSDQKENELKRVIFEAQKSLLEGKVAVVVIDSLMKRENEDYYEDISSKEAKIISKSFGYIAKALVSNGLVKNLVVSGGDTAINVFRMLRSNGIILENEILPGIPVGRVIGKRLNNLRVITKAGGFGNKDSFVDIIGFLTKNKEY
ncbi:hypothetical protein L1766_01745 [Thermovorax subterraneus]|nr:hypothetical protein [Thermovorax subterraneus]